MSLRADRVPVAAMGRTVSVAVEGSGPPILLLHGIGSSKVAFDRQLPVLSQRYRCIAWDAPGYGDSDDTPEAPGIDGYADAAVAVLREVDVRPAHIVGVSWGGVIATRLALRNPDWVRSLTLADSTRGSGASPEHAAAMRRRGDELDAAGPKAFAWQRAPRLISGNAPKGLVESVAVAMSRAIRNPGYRWAAEAMAETDHLPWLPTLTVPTLVLVGEHDTVTPLETSRELAAAIPGAVLHVLPGAGHLANQERPAAFNARLLAFLDSVEQGQAQPPVVHAPEGATSP